MVTIQNNSLPTPSFATQSERKEIPTLSTMQETMIHINIAADTLVSQVTPLLGITPRESTQLQNTNTQEDVEEILGTRAFQRYIDTPIQTLDRIIINQPMCFFPLAQEAQKIGEEIKIHPSMLINRQVPVLNLTITTITSHADLQDVFNSLCVCSHGGKRRYPRSKHRVNNYLIVIHQMKRQIHDSVHPKKKENMG